MIEFVEVTIALQNQKLTTGYTFYYELGIDDGYTH